MIRVQDIKALVPEPIDIALYGRIDRPEILMRAEWRFTNAETRDGEVHRFGMEQLVLPREGEILHALAELKRKYQATFAEYYEEEFGDA